MQSITYKHLFCCVNIIHAKHCTAPVDNTAFIFHCLHTVIFANIRILRHQFLFIIKQTYEPNNCVKRIIIIQHGRFVLTKKPIERD